MKLGKYLIACLFGSANIGSVTLADEEGLLDTNFCCRHPDETYGSYAEGLWPYSSYIGICNASSSITISEDTKEYVETLSEGQAYHTNAVAGAQKCYAGDVSNNGFYRRWRGGNSVFSIFFDKNNSCPAPNQNQKEITHEDLDEEINLLVKSNAVLNERYLVLNMLGRGTYGTVVEAYDTYQGGKCAIKMMPVLGQNRENAEWELRNLLWIASDDRHKSRHVISLKDHFEFRSFVCLVSDLLGQSLSEYMGRNDNLPLANSDIKIIGFQLFQSIEFIHSLGLIHTDLKSDNVLLVNRQVRQSGLSYSIPLSSGHRKVLQDSSIKIIDFGSAYFEWDGHEPVVTTRNYRAPEIMWGIGWSFPIDIWSIGCLLVELFTGHVLFLAHDDTEQLKIVETVFEYIAYEEAVEVGEGVPTSQVTDIFDRLDGQHLRTYRSRGLRKLQNAISHKSHFNIQFFDLLKKIFVRSRTERITAKQALDHPWFEQVDGEADATRH